MFTLPRIAAIDRTALCTAAKLWCAAMLLGLAGANFPWYRHVQFWLEFAWYFLLMWGLCSITPLVQMVRGWPRPQKMFCTLLLVLLAAGQIAHQPRKTFPFVHWGMYGRPRLRELEYFRYQGLTAENRRVVINPSVLFPSLGRGTYRIGEKLRRLGLATVKEAETMPNGPNQRKLSALLAAIAQQYNRGKRPQQQIESLAMLHCRQETAGGPVAAQNLVVVQSSRHTPCAVAVSINGGLEHKKSGPEHHNYSSGEPHAASP